MRTQQEHERAEQQRIKNLVLNLDLADDQQDGEPAFRYVQTTSSRTRLVGTGSLNSSLRPPQPSYRGRGQSQRSTSNIENKFAMHVGGGGLDHHAVSSPMVPVDNPSSTAIDSSLRRDSLTDDTGTTTFDALHGPPRFDKSGNTRSKQRARKLQLGDIDWYGNRSTSATSHMQHQMASDKPTSLDDYNVDKSGRGNRGGHGGKITQHKTTG